MSAKHARPTRAQARAGAHALQPQARSTGPDGLRGPARPYSRGVAATRSLRGRRAVRRARTLLATSSLVAGAAVVGVVGGTGTFALWEDSAQIAGSSVTSGTSGLEVTPTPLTASGMLPGDVAQFSFEIENTGDVRLDVRPTIEPLAEPSHFELRVLVTDRDENCTDPSAQDYFDLAEMGYAPIGTTFDPEAPVPYDEVIRPGETLQVCAQITALPTVLPLDSVDYTLDLDGEQVP